VTIGDPSKRNSQRIVEIFYAPKTVQQAWLWAHATDSGIHCPVFVKGISIMWFGRRESNYSGEICSIFLHRTPAMSSDGCLQRTKRDEPHRHRWIVISLVIADFSPLLSFWSKTTILLCIVEAMFTGGLGSAALQVERTLAATVQTYIERGDKRRCITIGAERIMETCR
jgi:hypothetical protein